jgi:hypothetical protein
MFVYEKVEPASVVLSCRMKMVKEMKNTMMKTLMRDGKRTSTTKTDDIPLRN